MDDAITNTLAGTIGYVWPRSLAIQTGKIATTPHIWNARTTA